MERGDKGKLKQGTKIMEASKQYEQNATKG